ncbi:hybrid-cluster NAD(P)-dependent oxidoreductase [Vibrio sp. SS-MA-C1-2]|uniref:hybrid-cluster NAD(P)-dependent oxidoreductase n=1 Tax=Vibrio sp. SS-MA-C1-2 TaxID=2908646 RepID=UPI001F3B497B|nr:hybrid-cluster NAD(P)-dependent oxidoreductase [Vibrio sp. SS-MA-C1-2]UJF19730.1 hybrid-cluster NAD(P)-dependent oxidoreductase [Vibrio sp. SS-MA-C1-2]
MSSSKPTQSPFSKPSLSPLKLSTGGLGGKSSLGGSPLGGLTLGGKKTSESNDSGNSPKKGKFQFAKSTVAPIWSPEKAPLVLKQRNDETHDSVSFIFETKEGHSFNFKAGQFVTISVEIEGKTHYRAYSISSAPKTKQLQLMIKRVEDGVVSNWMIDHLAIDDQITVFNVAGQFNLSDNTHKEKLLLVSAGCGITPVLSMAKALLTAKVKSPELDITFLHCARDKDNIIFHKELLALSEQYPQFHVALVLRDIADPDNQVQLPVTQGRINREKMAVICPDLADRSLLLCGPVEFMENIKTMADEQGLSANHFFHESFTPAAEELESDEKVTMTVNGYDLAEEVGENSLLLDDLEKHGLPIIGACRTGVCGSCKCKVTKGKVTSTSTETLTEEEIAGGYVLACSSRVKSDVTVELEDSAS